MPPATAAARPIPKDGITATAEAGEELKKGLLKTINRGMEDLKAGNTSEIKSAQLEAQTAAILAQKQNLNQAATQAAISGEQGALSNLAQRTTTSQEEEQRSEKGNSQAISAAISALKNTIANTAANAATATKSIARGAANTAGNAATATGGAAKGAITWSWEKITALGTSTGLTTIFFLLSAVLYIYNIWYQTPLIIKFISAVVLTILGWWMVYEMNGIESLFFCFAISMLTLFMPLAAALIGIDTLTMLLTYTPAWPAVILFFAKNKGGFLKFCTAIYIFVIVLMLFPATANAASKVLKSETLPFPDYDTFMKANKAAHDAGIKAGLKAIETMKNFPSTLKKTYANEMYYATHGYYPGDQEQTTKFIGIKFTASSIGYKEEYTLPNQEDAEDAPDANIPPEIAEVSARLKANSRKPITVELSCKSKYEECDSGEEELCEPKEQPVMPKTIKDQYTINQDIVCQPDLDYNSPRGRYTITIAATVKGFETKSVITENFVSEESMKEKLNKYYETHEVLNENEREGILKSFYSITQTPRSISEAGPVKLIISTGEDPVIGVKGGKDGTTLQLSIAVERSEQQEGNIEQVNSLTIELPKGIEVLPETRVNELPEAKEARAKNIENTNIGSGSSSNSMTSDILSSTSRSTASTTLGTTPGSKTASQEQNQEEEKQEFKTCPAFTPSTALTSAGGKSLALKPEYKRKGYIDFKKREQESYPKCFIYVASTEGMLRTPERPNPTSFTAKINYDYKIEKEFSIKWGKKIRTPKLGTMDDTSLDNPDCESTSNACPAVDSISQYPKLEDAKAAGAEQRIKEYEQYIQAASKKYGVCTALIKGITTVESGGVNVQTPNSARAIGLMQTLLTTRADGVTPLSGAGLACKQAGIISQDEDLKDAQKNINCGTWFFSTIMKKYSNDADKALGYYNGGFNGVNPATRSEETKKYVPMVIGYAKYYSSKESTPSTNPDCGGAQGSGSGTGIFTGTKFKTMPVDGKITITSCYGWRQLFGRRDYHDGVDINAGIGTPVKAVAAGTVYSAGPMGGYGTSVVIKHNSNLFTGYNHLSETKVSKGQKVSEGETIGLAGNTGVSTGPHLDFKIWDSASKVYGMDTAVNPFCRMPFDEAHGVTFIARSCSIAKQRSCT